MDLVPSSITELRFTRGSDQEDTDALFQDISFPNLTILDMAKLTWGFSYKLQRIFGECQQSLVSLSMISPDFTNFCACITCAPNIRELTLIGHGFPVEPLLPQKVPNVEILHLSSLQPSEGKIILECKELQTISGESRVFTREEFKMILQHELKRTQTT